MMLKRLTVVARDPGGSPVTVVQGKQRQRRIAIAERYGDRTCGDWVSAIVYNIYNKGRWHKRPA